jgi:hypothetical protein
LGLYLCAFQDERTDDEIDGVEVGSYADFGRFRDTVASQLEGGVWGSRFPTLMQHDDSDGIWTPEEASHLESELRIIAAELVLLPPIPFPTGWQQEVSGNLGLTADSLLASFIDVDGEPLVERLMGLARAAAAAQVPIWFQ